MTHDLIKTPEGLEIYHRKANNLKGPLPAFFYLALAGDESLNLDPFNQPVRFLDGAPLHVFSFTLPAHGPGYSPKGAISEWALELSKNHNFVADFVASCMRGINFLVNDGLVNPEKIAIGGLSRGTFLAAHIAAEDQRINSLLGFAPLTSLEVVEEFKETHNNLVQRLSMDKLADKLINKKIRFYIGNRDTRVGTEACFQCVKNFADTAYEMGIRSPAVELIISPSIGHKGHGTAPNLFEDGAKWIKKQLCEIL